MKKLIPIILIISALLLTITGCMSVNAAKSNGTVDYENKYEEGLTVAKLWNLDETGKIKDAESALVAIKVGMTYQEVVNCIGKAQRTVGCGHTFIQWDTESDGIIEISLGRDDPQCNISDMTVTCIRYNGEVIEGTDYDYNKNDFIDFDEVEFIK